MDATNQLRNAAADVEANEASFTPAQIQELEDAALAALAAKAAQRQESYDSWNADDQ